MAVYLPVGLVELFRYTLGMEWENVDTDAMRVDAHAWRAAAGKVRGTLEPEMAAAVRRVGEGIEGLASAALSRRLRSSSRWPGFCRTRRRRSSMSS